MDDDTCAISVFVELTKASDAVDHAIFLDKMGRHGIRGHTNDFQVIF